MWAWQPLAPASAQIQGGKSITATLAATLDDVTFSASATVSHSATLAVTLDDVSVSITATVAGHAPVFIDGGVPKKRTFKDERKAVRDALKIVIDGPDPEIIPAAIAEEMRGAVIAPDDEWERFYSDLTRTQQVLEAAERLLEEDDEMTLLMLL